MTIINRSHNFVFVHVPKTAGTSVTNVLSAYTTIHDLEIGGTKWGALIQRAYRQRFGVGKHATSQEIMQAVGEDFWRSSFNFGFCRHPLQRCYSTFNFLRKWESPDKSFNKTIRKFKGFEDFVRSGLLDETNGPDRIFCPQATWLCKDGSSESLMVDYVGRLEQINDEMKIILNRIGIQDDTDASTDVPVLNKSKGASKDLIWPEDVVARIREKYDVDYRVFGYE